MIDFLNQIETLLLDMLKFQAFPGIFLSTQTQVFQLFFLPILSNSRFSKVKWQPCNKLSQRRILAKKKIYITMQVLGNMYRMYICFQAYRQLLLFI